MPIPLPRPTPEEEDRFIETLSGQDPERIAEAVRATLAAGRPALAARAVGLLGDEGAIDSDLDKARRAAHFLLLKGGAASEVEEQLDWILERLRLRRMTRAKSRQRAKLKRRPRDPNKRRPR